VPGGPALLRLLEIKAFRRIWFAQIVSNLGDWAYTLAVGALLAGSLEGPSLLRTLALMVAAEGGMSALVGFLVAGPIADRFSRKRIMIVADLMRALVVGSLVFVGVPSLAHVVAVAACLGGFRAIFQPALMSALPSIAGPDLVTANAVVTATLHAAIMVGPAVGAVAVAAFGSTTAFAINRGVVRRLGVALGRHSNRDALPWSLADEMDTRNRPARGVRPRRTIADRAWRHDHDEHGSVHRFVASTAPGGDRSRRLGADERPRPSRRDPRCDDRCVGVGMVLGSLLMPFIARRIAPGRLLAVAIGLAGCAFMFAAVPRTIVGVVAAWVIVGLSSGLANVSYESLLQSSTPSGFLGRTFATVEAAQDAAFFLGALAVGALAWIIDPTMGLVAAGAAFLVISLIAGRLLDPRTAPEPAPIGAPVRERDAADLT
jgi:MFS family permease